METNKKSTDTILYIGEDQRYWNSVQQRLASISGKTIQYQARKMNSYATLPVDIMKIIIINPSVIYLDFTTNPTFALNLGKLLRRLSATQHIIIIALFDLSAATKSMMDAGHAGIYVNHLKGVDIHDIAYDALVLMYPQENIKCKFATAKTNRKIDLLETLYLRQATGDYIWAEGNAPLRANDQVYIDIEMFAKLVPSKIFSVVEVNNKDISYEFLHSYKLNFTFLDPLTPIEGESAEELKSREKEWKNKVSEIKDNFSDWIDRNYEKSMLTTRILFLDKQLTALEEFRKKTSKNPMVIRYQYYLSKPQEDLEIFRPNIIIFHYDPPLAPEGSAPTTNILENSPPSNSADNRSKEANHSQNKDKIQTAEEDDLTPLLRFLPQNDDAALDALLVAIKSMAGYNPVIIILSSNPQHGSAYFQNRLKYPRILHDKGTLNYEKMVKFEEAIRKSLQAEENKVLQQKLEKLKKINATKYRTTKIHDIRDKILYLKRSDNKSIVYLQHTATLTAISETEIELDSSRQLRLNTVYHMSTPQNVSITPVTETADKDKYHYRCILHSVGEVEKSLLRQFVNDIFLEFKRKERESEAAKFSQMNKDARKTKTDGAQ